MLRSIFEHNDYGVCGLVIGGNTSLKGEMWQILKNVLLDSF